MLLLVEGENIHIKATSPRIDTEIVDNQIPVVIERTIKLLDAMHHANLNNQPLKLPILSAELLLNSAKLGILAEQRLEQIAADKIKYAPHPSFIP